MENLNLKLTVFININKMIVTAILQIIAESQHTNFVYNKTPWEKLWIGSKVYLRSLLYLTGLLKLKPRKIYIQQIMLYRGLELGFSLAIPSLEKELRVLNDDFQIFYQTYFQNKIILADFL